MAMVCPKCSATSDKTSHCPNCGVRLLYQSRPRPLDLSGGTAGQWLHTPLGRVVAGIMLAQGLAYGLQLLCTAGLQAVEQPSASVWSTIFGLVLLQAIQGFSLLIGGGVAGAGQRRAFAVGAVVGVAHGLIFLVIQDLQGAEITEIALYGQPILHLAFGMLGAIIGSCIWRPLPTLVMPELDDNKANIRLSSGGWRALRGPIAWGRVCAGIVIVTAGFLWGPGLLAVALEASQGTLKVNDRLQAKVVTWEIIGLLTLLGAAVAGATTFNGFKQGLCVGVGASVVLIGNQLGGTSILNEQIGYTVFSIMGLTVVGGWFGGALFPPIRATARRRVGSAA